MAAYSVLFKRSVRRDLDGLPKRALIKILDRIGERADDPRPRGCEKLTGEEKYRVRQGKYRIVYSIQDHELTIWIVKVAHRRSAYR